MNDLISENPKTLECSIDWLEFTITIKMEIEQSLEMLGYKLDDFIFSDRGGLGYTRSARHIMQNIIVYWKGNEDMGIHYRVSGQAVAYFIDNYIEKNSVLTPFDKKALPVEEFSNDKFMEMLKKILEVGQFTRIDFSVDDYTTNYYSTDDVVELLRDGMCVSKFRSWQNVNTRSISTNDNQGHTIYFGSRKSDVFVRFYDKRLEQGKEYTWYRWELELKGIKAGAVVDMLINKDNIGAVTIGILSNYIRFIQLDRTRRENCSLEPRWEKFIAGVKKLKITLNKRMVTVDSKLDWINRQCMPTIAGLVKHNEGDLTFLLKDLATHYDRNSLANKKLFEGESAYLMQ